MEDLTIMIKLNTINKVKQFIEATTKFSEAEFDVAPLNGRIAVDGKSIMGIFSLDLSKNLNLIIHAPEAHMPQIQTELTAFVA